MRFSAFLNEQARVRIGAPKTQTISNEEAKAFLDANPKAKQALKNGHKIYRGWSSDNSGNQFGDSRTFKRKAAYTKNFINSFLTTIESWKHLPSRQSAFICSTSKDDAARYGDVFIVIPSDAARIGVCPDSDFWYSFTKTLSNFKNNRVDIDRLNSLINQIDIVMAEKLSGKTSSQLRDYFSNLDSDDIESIAHAAHASVKQIFLIMADKMSAGNLNFAELLDELLDADTNGFYEASGPSALSAASDSEVWINGECIFISVDNEKFLKTV